jgi:hypothetical protein
VCASLAALSSTATLADDGFVGRWKAKNVWVQWIIRPTSGKPGTYTLAFYPYRDPHGVRKWYQMSELHKHGNELAGDIHWKGPMNTSKLEMSHHFLFDLRDSKLHVVSTTTDVNNRAARGYVGRKYELDFVRVK